MSDNRLEALAAFLAANPDLPEGTDTPAPAPKAAPRARLTVSRRPQEAHGHGRLGARLRSAAARRLPRQGT